MAFAIYSPGPLLLRSCAVHGSTQTPPCRLLFATMCHGTWNFLSEVEVLRPFLYAWRGDNAWLHSVGGWTIGVWTLLHVWSLLFPSIFHGFRNVNAEGWWEWFPTQVKPVCIPYSGRIVSLPSGWQQEPSSFSPFKFPYFDPPYT